MDHIPVAHKYCFSKFSFQKFYFVFLHLYAAAEHVVEIFWINLLFEESIHSLYTQQFSIHRSSGSNYVTKQYNNKISSYFIQQIN